MADAAIPKDPELEPVGYQLIDLRISELSLRFPEEVEAGAAESAKFSFSVGLNIVVPEKQVRIRLSVMCHTGEDVESSTIIRLALNAVYALSDMDPLPVGESGEKALPEELFAILLGPMIGAARGIILLQSDNSPFGRLLLPLVDPVDLLRRMYGHQLPEPAAPSRIPAK